MIDERWIQELHFLNTFISKQEENEYFSTHKYKIYYQKNIHSTFMPIRHIFHQFHLSLNNPSKISLDLLEKVKNITDSKKNQYNSYTLKGKILLFFLKIRNFFSIGHFLNTAEFGELIVKEAEEIKNRSLH